MSEHCASTLARASTASAPSFYHKRDVLLNLGPAALALLTETTTTTHAEDLYAPLNEHGTRQCAMPFSAPSRGMRMFQAVFISINSIRTNRSAMTVLKLHQNDVLRVA